MTRLRIGRKTNWPRGHSRLGSWAGWAHGGATTINAFSLHGLLGLSVLEHALACPVLWHPEGRCACSPRHGSFWTLLLPAHKASFLNVPTIQTEIEANHRIRNRTLPQENSSYTQSSPSGELTPTTPANSAFGQFDCCSLKNQRTS